jgi:adenylylsulfate kinase-like enzyme
MRRVPVLWVCGPSGVGKTSVGYALFSQLSQAGTATAFVDLDQLGLCYPAPDDDRRHNRLKARNLGAAWSAFQAAGARCLVVSGLVDNAEEVRRHADALPGSDLTVCRLRVAPDELRDRITRRGSWLQLTEEAVRNATELDRSTFADLVVDTTGKPVHAVVALLRESGWPGLLTQSEAPTPSPVSRPAGTPKVLLVCGPPAVGKSTVGYEIFRRVVGDGITAAYVDLAQIGFCRPADQHDLKAHLLGRLWEGFAAAGARCLIISGAIADRAELSHYTDAFPTAAWRVCRLRAEPDTLTGRVLLRGAGGGPAIAGDDLRGLPEPALRERATRAVQIAAALDRAAVGDLCVDTDGREVGDLADLVRARLGGWPGA